MENNPIIRIEESDDKYRYCNVCNQQVNEKERAQNLVDDNKMHEMSFGRNNHCTTICLCTKCLNIFAEKLWEYL